MQYVKLYVFKIFSLILKLKNAINYCPIPNISRPLVSIILTNYQLYVHLKVLDTLVLALSALKLRKVLKLFI